MNNFKIFFSLFFLFCFSYSSAQVPLSHGPGCLFNGKVYQKSLGNYTDGTPLYEGYLTNYDCTGTYSLPDPPWTETGGNGSCTVWVDCTGTSNSNYKKGKLGMVNLPIDDYILPFFLFIGPIAIYSIRKQKLSF